MKKMLAFLAVAIMATMTVKASTVDWSVDTWDIVVPDGWTVQAYVGDISSAVTSWGNKTLDIAGITSSVGTGVNGTGIMDFDGSQGKSQGLSNSDSLSVVIFSGTVEDGGTFYYTAAKSVNGHTYEPPTPASPLKFMSADFSTGTFAAKAVPEPCSVALLALGVAAFGLRRKVQA